MLVETILWPLLYVSKLLKRQNVIGFYLIPCSNYQANTTRFAC